MAFIHMLPHVEEKFIDEKGGTRHVVVVFVVLQLCDVTQHKV
jgi:hypothetical protein